MVHLYTREALPTHIAPGCILYILVCTVFDDTLLFIIVGGGGPFGGFLEATRINEKIYI